MVGWARTEDACQDEHEIKQPSLLSQLHLPLTGLLVKLGLPWARVKGQAEMQGRGGSPGWVDIPTPWDLPRIPSPPSLGNILDAVSCKRHSRTPCPLWTRAWTLPSKSPYLDKEITLLTSNWNQNVPIHPIRISPNTDKQPWGLLSFFKRFLVEFPLLKDEPFLLQHQLRLGTWTFSFTWF